jgi:hypothetical protein
VTSRPTSAALLVLYFRHTPDSASYVLRVKLETVLKASFDGTEGEEDSVWAFDLCLETFDALGRRTEYFEVTRAYRSSISGIISVPYSFKTYSCRPCLKKERGLPKPLVAGIQKNHGGVIESGSQKVQCDSALKQMSSAVKVAMRLSAKLSRC